MRISLLHPCYWPEVRRGSERFIHDLGWGLAAQGDQASLITSHRGPPSRRMEDEMQVVRLPRPPDGRLRRRLFEDHLTHLPGSYVALWALRPDVAHALSPADALPATLWARQTGRPAVFSYMGLPARWYLASRRLRTEVMARACRESDAVVALSQTAARAFEHELGVKARAIYPGVDTDAFTPAPEQRAPSPMIFCAAATDAPAKRVDLLLKAFQRLREQLPEARLVLSRPGGGASRALGKGVELRDVDDRELLRNAYREAWISVLPSRGEAFGLVLVESMACGTPVVGSRLGAIPEVVGGDEVGCLFGDEQERDDDDRALCAALLEGLERSRDERVVAACRARALQFSTARCVDAYRALYAELAQAGHGRT